MGGQQHLLDVVMGGSDVEPRVTMAARPCELLGKQKDVQFPFHGDQRLTWTYHGRIGID